MQQIHLEVLNEPDWATIRFAQPDLLMDIPFDGEPASVEHTSLIIRINENAPAESPYTITVRATCENIGRINAFSTNEDVVFRPQYEPCLNLYPDNHIYAPPNQWTYFRIYAKNCGNALTRVSATLKNHTSDFSVLINPPFVDLGVDEGYILGIERL